MFYIVSKVFWVLVQPGVIGLALLALGLGLSFTRWILVGQIIIGVMVLIGALALILPIDDWLYAPLEDRFARPNPPAHIDGIIVLGGGELRRVSRARGVPASQRLMRLVDAAALLRLHPEARLYFTGGGADYDVTPPTEADIARDLLRLLNADMTRVFVEGKSRDTWENLLNLRQVAQPRPGEVWVLVTSAFHMPRAIGIARKLGWPMIAWPTDYGSIPDARLPDKINPLDRLVSAQNALHEWVGLVAYALLGKTDAIFPAPAHPVNESATK